MVVSLASLGQSRVPTAKKAPVLVKKTTSAPARPTSVAEAPVVNYNVVPLFGELSKTPKQQAREDQFLASCDQNFESRAAASQFFAERGWEYVTEGSLDTATYRFNLAHLLNPQSADPYWGLGVIQFNKGNPEAAIDLLGRGLTVDSSNATLMTDLATLHLNRYKTDSAATDLTRATGLLNRAVTIDTSNANAFLKLSLAAFYGQQYDQAWTYFHRARRFDVKNLDFNFLTQLMARKEDPLGVFKQN